MVGRLVHHAYLTLLVLIFFCGDLLTLCLRDPNISALQPLLQAQMTRILYAAQFTPHPFLVVDLRPRLPFYTTVVCAPQLCDTQSCTQC